MEQLPALPSVYRIAPDVAHARSLGSPIVALESTVITHGLPYPENLNAAQDMENVLRQGGVTPATIAVLEGSLHVGVNQLQLERLVSDRGAMKIGPRDFALAIARGRSGGTTVAGTLVAARAVGIQVFATGGIGGVHHLPEHDVSADLLELSRSPLVVICAGAKAILNIAATLEVLETYGVPVVGYQTDIFPAFYAESSGLPVSARVESAEEAAQLARANWNLGLHSAVLVAVPPPQDVALSPHVLRDAIERALEEAQENEIRGQAVTPFLLKRLSELTGGASLRANLGLLRNNARLAGEIAQHLNRDRRLRRI